MCVCVCECVCLLSLGEVTILDFGFGYEAKFKVNFGSVYKAEVLDIYVNFDLLCYLSKYLVQL